MSRNFRHDSEETEVNKDHAIARLGFNNNNPNTSINDSINSSITEQDEDDNNELLATKIEEQELYDDFSGYIKTEENEMKEKEEYRVLERRVSKLFHGEGLELVELAKINANFTTPEGRLYFARILDVQRTKDTGMRLVDEAFDSLTDLIIKALNICNDNDDFRPAKILMHMASTFYHEIEKEKEYIQTKVKALPIWQNQRFWEAAFHDSMNYEHMRVFARTREERRIKYKELNTEERAELQVKEQQLAFGQLGSYLYNMLCMGVPVEFTRNFLLKMVNVFGVPNELVQQLIKMLESTSMSLMTSEQEGIVKQNKSAWLNHKREEWARRNRQRQKTRDEDDQTVIAKNNAPFNSMPIIKQETKESSLPKSNQSVKKERSIVGDNINEKVKKSDLESNETTLEKESKSLSALPTVQPDRAQVLVQKMKKEKWLQSQKQEWEKQRKIRETQKNKSEEQSVVKPVITVPIPSDDASPISSKKQIYQTPLPLTPKKDNKSDTATKSPTILKSKSEQLVNESRRKSSAGELESEFKKEISTNTSAVSKIGIRKSSGETEVAKIRKEEYLVMQAMNQEREESVQIIKSKLVE